MTKEEALDRLRGLLPEGATAYTVLRHVSQSGMTRAISVLTVTPDGRIRDVSGLVAKVTTFKLHKTRDGLSVGGAGMDMGFHVVYTLARVLYGDGYALRHEWA